MLSIQQRRTLQMPSSVQRAKRWSRRQKQNLDDEKLSQGGVRLYTPAFPGVLLVRAQ